MVATARVQSRAASCYTRCSAAQRGCLPRGTRHRRVLATCVLATCVVHANTECTTCNIQIRPMRCGAVRCGAVRCDARPTPPVQMRLRLGISVRAHLAEKAFQRVRVMAVPCQKRHSIDG